MSKNIIVETNIISAGETVKIISAGMQGPEAGGGASATEVFVQGGEPTVTAGAAFIWVQTGLGDGTDFRVYAGVGL